MMPQVGGMDLLRFIRSHQQLGDLPVVSECACLHQPPTRWRHSFL